ncbi:cytochrome C biosynthesis protein [Altererythrobacter lauratis]|uniref:Tetratricopeptide repeat protein n=1 Tax=Alteraurantiacibacter lauratis TaxID=2054627 RepID=A0ABV7EI98_9SPHN
MSWIMVIVLALVSFGVAVSAFRLPRVTWTSLAAALLFGLAGYTLQASPGLPGAPRANMATSYTDEWQMRDARVLLVGESLKSRSNAIVTSDAFAQRGQFTDAVGFADIAIRENAQDFEAWLALGNALVEQADGALTQPSLFAYRQASAIAPDNPAPSYFLGLSLIRQGRMVEAYQIWRGALERMGEEGTPAQGFMAERVARLETMLAQAGALPPSPGTAADQGE